MDQDQEFCHKCDRVTWWRRMRGGKRLKCEGCQDVYPCRNQCTHQDCEKDRS